MMIVLILCAFTLSLSAADSPKNKQIPIGETLCELVIHNGVIAPNELIRFPCINQYINVEASKKLDEHRLALKNYIEKRYLKTYCEVTYSQNKLEAAIIKEDTVIVDDNEMKERAFFRYVYFKDAENITSQHIDNTTSGCNTTYKPFFTKDYACFNFLGTKTVETRPSKGPRSIHDEPYSKVITWKRSTLALQICELQIKCDKVSTNAYWFSKKLPYLYKKAMQNVYTCTKIVNATFVINLAQTGILTKKDVHTLNKFIPGGKYQKWFDIPEKYGYSLLNILACYGSPRTLLDEINNQVGKYKTKWEGLGKVHASHCIENIEVLFGGEIGEYISFTEDNIFQRLSATARATLDYIAQLKKEGIFVEKDWHHKTDLKKRVKLYNQAIKFLRHKRMTWKIKGKYLIRYDCLNNRVTVLHKLAHNLSAAVEKNVPSSINFDSITVCYDATKPLGMNGYTIQYQLYKTAENNEDSESSDVLVESSDEE